jgi:hypothetical protein
MLQGCSLNFRGAILICQLIASIICDSKNKDVGTYRAKGTFWAVGTVPLKFTGTYTLKGAFRVKGTYGIEGPSF